MKKITLLMVLVAFSNIVNAQRLEIREVPEAVMIAFRKANPGAGNPQWRKEKGCYQAKCMVNNTQRTFRYSKMGTPIVNDGKAAMTVMPSGIKEYIDKNYSGAPIDKAVKAIKPDGSVSYLVGVAGNDLIFDGNGKFLKSKKSI